MKKILFFMHGMELGGAERALLGILEHLDYSRCQVDLFLMHHEGELLRYVPAQVNLLPEIPAYSCLAVPMSHVLRKRQFSVAAGRTLGKLSAKKRVKALGLPADNGVELEYSHKYTLFAMPKINDKEYDLAVSFLTPHYFVADRVKARRKVAWIHTDYSRVPVDTQSELKMWSEYDHVISISASVTETFSKVFPQLRKQMILIDNMLPENSIALQADEPIEQDEMPADGSIRLLSIGRYCTAKNFDNVPEICRLLREAGLNVKWYLIGFGPDESLIRSRIEQAGMQEHVIMLGKKDNPYPYIKACDVYVQPSRYEGKCVTVREAQMLSKPVVISRYATSASQLEEGVDGVIVPQDNEGCARGIAALLCDKHRQQELMAACAQRDYSNAQEIEKIYRMME